MKLKIILIGLFFFCIGKNNILADENDHNISIYLPKIVINDMSTDSLINIIIKDNKDYLKKKCFLLVSIIRENDTYYINIVIYEKKKFEIICPKNDYPIIGYFEINGQIVLVVGEYLFSDTEFLNDKKIFTFKCKKAFEKHIIPPPLTYNPPSYKFIYKNNSNNLKKYK